ncbi:MAG: phage shock protein E [Urechidicola sp.]|jgi:phage shock protein E|tara:strand:+ start:1565 stop:1990 length:426 start_codon:yes stop_codon:yes gene_type:complete
MKIVQLITLVSFIILFSFSCESSIINENVKNLNQITETAKDINVSEFKELINFGSIILDVRRPVEFNAGHLENAININYFDNDFITQVSKLDKSKTLLIHCASGGRSSAAMNKLKGNDFSIMYNMLGGFSVWEKSGFKVVK